VLILLALLLSVVEAQLTGLIGGSFIGGLKFTTLPVRVSRLHRRFSPFFGFFVTNETFVSLLCKQKRNFQTPTPTLVLTKPNPITILPTIVQTTKPSFIGGIISLPGGFTLPGTKLSLPIATTTGKFSLPPFSLPSGLIGGLFVRKNVFCFLLVFQQ
jgi:hypothetical protein